MLPYALTMLTALIACSVMLRHRQRALPLTSSQKAGLAIGAFCGAMVGAKLPFVLSDREGLLTGLAWLSHGKTIMSGIAGGYLGVEAAKWALEIRVKTGDSYAAPVALAVAIGRLACFQAGCCFGRPTDLPWGTRFPSAGDQLGRHPTQLYETLFHLAAFAALLWLERRDRFPRQRLKLYLLAYLGYRFATEWIRPEPAWWLGGTAYQWAAVVLAIVLVGLWIRDRQPAPAPDG